MSDLRAAFDEVTDLLAASSLSSADRGRILAPMLRLQDAIRDATPPATGEGVTWHRCRCSENCGQLQTGPGFAGLPPYGNPNPGCRPGVCDDCANVGCAHHRPALHERTKA